jgi:hypothetical protein
MKNIKYIVLFFVLFFTKSLMAQMTMDAAKEKLHLGEILIDPDGASSVTADVKTALINAVGTLRQKNIFLNVIIKSRDCGTEPLKWELQNENTENSFIIGKGELYKDKDIWFLQDVKNKKAEELNKIYVLYIYPNGGALYRNTYDINNPSNDQWEVNRSLVFKSFSETLSTATGPFQYELCQKVNKAFEIIKSMHPVDASGLTLAKCPFNNKMADDLFANNYKAFNNAKSLAINSQDAKALNDLFIPERKKLKSDFCTNVYFYDEYFIAPAPPSELAGNPGFVKQTIEEPLKQLSVWDQSQVVFVFRPTTNASARLTGLYFKPSKITEANVLESQCYNLAKDLSQTDLKSFVGNFTSNAGYPNLSSGAKKAGIAKTLEFITNVVDPNKDSRAGNSPADCLNNTAIQEEGAGGANITYPILRSENGDGSDGEMDLIVPKAADAYDFGTPAPTAPTDFSDADLYGDYPSTKLVTSLKKAQKNFSNHDKKLKIVYCGGAKKYKEARKGYDDKLKNLGPNESLMMIMVYKDKYGKKQTAVDFDISPNTPLKTPQSGKNLSATERKQYIARWSKRSCKTFKKALDKGITETNKDQQKPYNVPEVQPPAGELSLNEILQKMCALEQDPNVGNGQQFDPWNCFVKENFPKDQIDWSSEFLAFGWDLMRNVEIQEEYWHPTKLKGSLDFPGGLCGPINSVLGQVDNVWTTLISTYDMLEGLVMGDAETRKQLLLSLRYPHLALLKQYGESLCNILYSPLAEERYYHMGFMGTELIFTMLSPGNGLKDLLQGAVTDTKKSFKDLGAATKYAVNPTQAVKDGGKAIIDKLKQNNTNTTNTNKTPEQHRDDFYAKQDQLLKGKENTPDGAKYANAMRAKIAETLGHLSEAEQAKVHAHADAILPFMMAMHPEDTDTKHAFESKVTGQHNDKGLLKFDCAGRAGKCPPSAAKMAEFFENGLPKEDSPYKADFYKNLADFHKNIDAELAKSNPPKSKEEVADLKFRIGEDLTGALTHPDKNVSEQVQRQIAVNPLFMTLAAKQHDLIVQYSAAIQNPEQATEYHKELSSDNLTTAEADGMKKLFTDQFLKDHFANGQKFEKNVNNAFTKKDANGNPTKQYDKNSDFYKDTKKRIADNIPPPHNNIDDYDVYSQVKMCTKNPNCTEYSVADQVFIKKDAQGNVFMIISDSKIKESTDYTRKQKALRSQAKNGLLSDVLKGNTAKDPLIKNPVNDNKFKDYQNSNITVLGTLKIHSENGNPDSAIKITYEKLK